MPMRTPTPAGLLRFLLLLAFATAVALVGVLSAQKRALRHELVELRRNEMLQSVPQQGHVLPAFGAVALSGERVDVVPRDTSARQVLFFFNTRCGWCLRTLPSWERIARRVSGLDRSDQVRSFV